MQQSVFKMLQYFNDYDDYSLKSMHCTHLFIFGSFPVILSKWFTDVVHCCYWPFGHPLNNSIMVTMVIECIFVFSIASLMISSHQLTSSSNSFNYSKYYNYKLHIILKIITELHKKIIIIFTLHYHNLSDSI